MNNSLIIIKSGRIVSPPDVRTAGTTQLVTVRIAINTFGEKAKARYRESYFVDATFAGRQAETAAGLGVGDQIGCQGALLMRDYTTKAGEDRVAYEIPYADGLIVHNRKEAPADTAAPPAAKVKAKAPPADDPFDFA